MSTTSSKISQFISRTGSSNKVAQELLKENQWNVDCAVNVYKLMNEVSVMPKKNSNSKQNFVDVQSSTMSRHLTHDFRSTNKIKPAAQDFCRNSSESLTPSHRNGNTSSSKKQRSSEVQSRPTESAQESRNLPSDDSSDSTFILPDFSSYPDDFRNFLDKDLIETSTLDLLMKAGRLNWWSDLGCQPLFPLVTTGDGNCLLHAASLALWGHQDTELDLRKRLFEMMLGGPHHNAFFRRWKWHQMQINKQSELVYSDQEWQEEWNSLVKLASPQPRLSSCNVEPTHGLNPQPSSHHHDLTMNGSHNPQYDQQEIQYESLEELHIFVLAHLLQRPIIITADTILRDSGGEALAPITFGGVYLPLEHPPALCHRFPILLTYDAAHFSALVPTEDSFQTTLVISRGSDGNRAFSGSVPLVDFNLDLLPVHFVRDPGPNYNWNEEKQKPGLPEAGAMNEESTDEPNGVDEDDNASDEVSLSEKVAALKKYLDIEVVSVSPLANSISSLDSGESVPIHDNNGSENLDRPGMGSVAGGSTENPDSRRVSETSAKVNSESEAMNCQSSLEPSPKSNVDHLISNDLFSEEKSKREKNKSLGRLRKIAKSVSANFKRSFNVKNSVKHTPVKCPDLGVKEKQVLAYKNIKTESPASSPEPSNVVAFIVESLEKKSRIPCAKLLYKRQSYQTEIIRNYLEQASERFLITRKRELERMQVHPLSHHHPPEKPFEVFHRGSQQPLNNAKQATTHPYAPVTVKVQTSPVQCINLGCNGRATSDTSYLCAECYEKQRNEEAKIKGNNNVNNSSTAICCMEESSEGRAAKLNNSNKSGCPKTGPELKETPGKSVSKNIVSSSTLKSSISDDFRPGSSRIVLEKYTKVDNRMLVATETTEADFQGNKLGSDGQPEDAARGATEKINSNAQVSARNLPSVEEVEKSIDAKCGRCPTEGCPFYGSQLTDRYCSSCYKKRSNC